MLAYSFNIDTNIGRTENGFARLTHPKWRINERLPAIIKEIRKGAEAGAAVFCIQEARKLVNDAGEIVDSITPLVDLFKELGYSVCVQPYTDDERAFSYITAYAPKVFELVDRRAHYMSKTPEISSALLRETDPEAAKENNFGDLFERCVPELTLLHADSGKTVALFNVHLGMPLTVRMASAQLLNEFMTAARDRGELVLAMGDFNSFSDWGGAEQMATLAEFADATDGWVSSFISFPYDFGKAERAMRAQLQKIKNEEDVDVRRKLINDAFVEHADALGGHLDHVLHAGFSRVEATLIITAQFGEPDAFDEPTVKAYIMDHINDGPAFASDHQLVRVEFEF